MTLSSSRVAIENLRAAFDRKPVAGRFVVADIGDGRRRLEAELNAAELDLDAAQGIVKALGTDLKLPHEMLLALDIERATLASIDARGIKAKLRLDADRLAIEALAIRDLSGAALSAAGATARPVGNAVRRTDPRYRRPPARRHREPPRARFPRHRGRFAQRRAARFAREAAREARGRLAQVFAA